MIGRVRRVVRVPVGERGQQVAQRLQEIKVGAGVKIGSSQRAGRVGDKNDTHALARPPLAQRRLHRVRNINNLVFSVGRNGDCLHMLCYNDFPQAKTTPHAVQEAHQA